MKNILFSLLLFALSVNAQSVKKRTVNVSPVIASLLQDFSSTVKLPDDKLVLLIKYLQNQERIIQQEIKNGSPILQILDLFAFEPNKVNQLTGAKPSDVYYQKGNLNISSISYALLFRNRLKFDDVQIEKLLQLNQKEKDEKIAVIRLSGIINSIQTNKLFELIYAKEASDWAIRDWQKFKDFKITDGLDSLEVYNIIYNYRCKRLAFHHFYTKIGQEDSVAKAGFRHSTTDLPRVFLKALKPGKYRTYFEKSNRDEVEAIVKKNWGDLKLLGLGNKIDSATVKSVLWNYEMDSRFAGNRVFIENSLKSVFARQDLVNRKPAILKKLEKERSNSINNKF